MFQAFYKNELSMRILLLCFVLSILASSCGLQGVMGNRFTRCVSSIIKNPSKTDSICKSYNVKLSIDKSLNENDYKILQEIFKNQGRSNWGYIQYSNDTRYGVSISSKDYRYSADFDFKFENDEWILFMIRPGDSEDRGVFE